MFTLISDPRTRAAYCGLSRDSTDIDMGNSIKEESQPSLRDAKPTKGMHISYLVYLQWETAWHGSSLKESLMNEMFFRMIAISVQDIDDEDSVTIQLYVFDCSLPINCNLVSSL